MRTWNLTSLCNPWSTRRNLAFIGYELRPQASAVHLVIHQVWKHQVTASYFLFGLQYDLYFLIILSIHLSSIFDRRPSHYFIKWAFISSVHKLGMQLELEFHFYVSTINFYLGIGTPPQYLKTGKFKCVLLSTALRFCVLESHNNGLYLGFYIFNFCIFEIRQL